MGLLTGPMIWLAKQVILSAAVTTAYKASKNAVNEHVVPRLPLPMKLACKKLGIRQPEEFDTLDDWLKEAATTPEGKEALRQVLKNQEKFFSNYRVQKAKSDLRNIDEIAEASGIPKDTIIEIEKGEKMPTVGNIAKLARAFKCSMEDLVE